MFTITRHKSPPDLGLLRQIVDMTVASAADLGLTAVPASNPLSGIYDLVLAMEINTYIAAIGHDNELLSGLVVATDRAAPDRLVGFLLYQGLANVLDGCGINYMAVNAGDRRQGAARAMVEEVLRSHPHATLTCTIAKVPYYEAMGFKIVGSRHNQVRMNTFGFSTSNVQNVLNVEAFLQHPQVQAAQRTLIQKYGTKDLRDAEKQIKRGVERGTTKAESYVRERLGPAGTTPGA